MLSLYSSLTDRRGVKTSGAAGTGPEAPRRTAVVTNTVRASAWQRRPSPAPTPPPHTIGRAIRHGPAHVATSVLRAQQRADIGRRRRHRVLAQHLADGRKAELA